MIAVTIAAVIALFVLCNVVAVRTLIRLHSRRKSIVIALVTIGNLMWLFFPILNARTDFSRLVRAVFGPPWFAWLAFVLVYSAFAAVAYVATGFSPSRTIIASRIFIWGTLVAVLIGIYGALVPLRVEHVAITLRDLPSDLEGF